MKLAFKEGKPTVYKIAQTTQDPIKYKALLEEVSRSCGLNRAMTMAAVESLKDCIAHYIELGFPVQMGDFGTFKPVFTAKTQKTVEELGADNVKAIKLRFYPGEVFKNVLGGMSVSEQSLSSSLVEDEDASTSTGGTDSGSSDDEGTEFT